MRGGEHHRRAALRALLDALEPADATEAAHRDAMRALLEVPGDPFSRDHWAPGHFTASAFVLSPDHAEVLLILHGKLGRWLQPGGHIDPDDADVIAAARREVAEETGLRDVEVLGAGLFDVDVHEIPARHDAPAHRHYDARVLLRAASRDHQAGSDARAARWVPLPDVTALESDASVLRAIAKLQGRGQVVRTHATDER